jgi:hypothetical protein
MSAEIVGAFLLTRSSRKRSSEPSRPNRTLAFLRMEAFYSRQDAVRWAASLSYHGNFILGISAVCDERTCVPRVQHLGWLQGPVV